MLYEQLDLAEVEPLDGGLRWLVPALVAGAAASGALLFFLIGQPIYGGLFLAGFVGMLVAAFVMDRKGARRIEVAPIVLPDLALAGSALDLSADPAAITDADGTLKAINSAYKARFGGTPNPAEAGKDKKAAKALSGLKESALRDGHGAGEATLLGGASSTVKVTRIGANRDLLLWRFTGGLPEDPLDVAAKRIAGQTGERLAAAGVLAVLVDADGRLVAANALFSDRALGGAISAKRPPRFAELVEPAGDGSVKLIAEGPDARPMRLVTVPVDIGESQAAATLLMFDADQGPSLASSTNVQVLLEMLPIGLALVDRDGRFLTMNKAFRQAGGIRGEEMPSYPGDLVVKEDKAAVADAVRRNARGPAMSGDLAV